MIVTVVALARAGASRQTDTSRWAGFETEARKAASTARARRAARRRTGAAVDTVPPTAARASPARVRRARARRRPVGTDGESGERSESKTGAKARAPTSGQPGRGLAGLVARARSGGTGRSARRDGRAGGRWEGRYPLRKILHTRDLEAGRGCLRSGIGSVRGRAVVLPRRLRLGPGRWSPARSRQMESGFR